MGLVCFFCVIQVGSPLTAQNMVIKIYKSENWSIPMTSADPRPGSSVKSNLTVESDQSPQGTAVSQGCVD